MTSSMFVLPMSVPKKPVFVYSVTIILYSTDNHTFMDSGNLKQVIYFLLTVVGNQWKG